MKQILILIIWCLAWLAYGQQGVLTYKIVHMELPDSLEVADQAQISLKNLPALFTMRIYFKPGMSRTELEAMNGMFYVQNFWETKRKTLTVFSDVMGRRQKVIVPVEQLDQFGKSKEIFTPDKIEKAGQFKYIMGLKCQLTRIKDQPGDIWVCTELKLPVVGYGLEQFGLNNIGGLPLEYSIQWSGLSLVIRAVNLTNKTAKHDFIQPGGYETIRLEDYLQQTKTR